MEIAPNCVTGLARIRVGQYHAEGIVFIKRGECAAICPATLTITIQPGSLRIFSKLSICNCDAKMVAISTEPNASSQFFSGGMPVPDKQGMQKTISDDSRERASRAAPRKSTRAMTTGGI